MNQITRRSRTASVLRNESGVVVIYVALILSILLGFASLAIDVGHLMVVRNELQNASDAAALAGASCLYPQTPSGSPSPPDWSTAESRATSAIVLNKSGGVTLTDIVVETGYWNMAHNPGGLQSTEVTPGHMDFPAVRVTVTKAPGSNGGPVKHWFAQVLGIRTSNVSARATAVMASPGTARAGALLPLAITKAVADQKSSYTCPSHTFRIGSSYHYPTYQAGQWTSFKLDANDVPTVRDLIADGNPDPISVGDNIWIEPGTKTTLYSSIPIGKDVVLPVIENITTHAEVPVVGFVCFHITNSVGGSEKYIEGCFNDSCYAGLTYGVGPNYGAYAPPSLVE